MRWMAIINWRRKNSEFKDVIIENIKMKHGENEEMNPSQNMNEASVR